MQNNTYNFRENRCILIGDTHSTDNTLNIIKRLPIRGCDLFHVGDGGWGFGLSSYAISNAKTWAGMINEMCIKNDHILYHNIGNHDNPEVWRLFATEFSNLKFVRTGDVLVFPNGKRVMVFGGGISIDRISREEGISYWKDEITPEIDITEQYDYVFSHDCPDWMNHPTASLGSAYGWYVTQDPSLLKEAKDQRDVIERLLDKTGATKIFYGHFHNSRLEVVNGVTGRCLDINEVYELSAE